MINDELYALLAARMNGEVRHLLLGEEDHLNGADGRRRWMAILDDRTPGTYGPSSFEGPAFRKVLGSTTVIVVDFSADPDPQVYDLLAEVTVLGTRLLAIQTIPDRAATWREFLYAHWTGSHIAEVVPIDNCPTTNVRLRMTRLHDEAGSEGLSGADAAQPWDHAWDTPWGKAIRVTYFGPGTGIEFMETATHGGYHLSPERNSDVPEELRDATVVGQGHDGWYEQDRDGAIVVLSFPDCFSADEREAAEVIVGRFSDGDLKAPDPNQPHCR
jgi:hypothetical protein